MTRAFFIHRGAGGDDHPAGMRQDFVRGQSGAHGGGGESCSGIKKTVETRDITGAEINAYGGGI